MFWSRSYYNPKTPTPFINQFIIIFRETESLLLGLIISGKQIWWTSVLRRYKFLLTCSNVFSKFAWVVPLKNKLGETLVNGFQSILDLGRSLEKLQTDKGTEFLSRNFQSLLKENSIHFFTTNSELKASVVERFNRTLKTRMWKYFTA